MLAQLSLQEGEALLLLKEHLDLVQVEDIVVVVVVVVVVALVVVAGPPPPQGAP